MPAANHQPDDEFPHLAPTTIKYMNLEASARIEIAQSPCWIANKYAVRLLDKLEYLLAHPKSLDMPNLLIVGRSGNGKTSVIQELLKRHPRDENVNGESVCLPIVYIEVPPFPDLGGFYNEILESLGAGEHRGRIDDRRRFAQHCLELVGARLLVIDEVQHWLSGGPSSQRIFLNAIKSLGNHLQISIVCLGTREALILFKRDEQIRRRFACDELSTWKLNAEFRRLLLSYEMRLPLRVASNLAGPELGKLLYSMTGGTIGRLARVLAQASAYAISSGAERITPEILSSLDLNILDDGLQAG